MEDVRHEARPETSPQPRPPTRSSANAVDYRSEAVRAKSLLEWPARNFMNPEETAKSGLYYFGEGDKVRCHFCRVVLSRWTVGDDADADHCRWSPSCPLLLRLPVGNVPIPGADECGPYEIKPARYPAYATGASRLASFNNWPAGMRQRPQALADAGFFYSGTSDRTLCHCCGGGLEDWDDDDVPWEQHALWFTECLYLRACKGEGFIDKVVKEKTPQNEDTVSLADDTPAEDYYELCKICFAKERNVCYIPCGHVVACVKCALSVSSCPVCRKKFTSTVRIYLA